MKIVKTTVTNNEGLHMRPALFIVDIAAEYDCDVIIATENTEADAKSIMQVMMVYAPIGTEITISAEGEGEEEVVERIVDLIIDGFPDKEYRKAEKLREISNE